MNDAAPGANGRRLQARCCRRCATTGLPARAGGSPWRSARTVPSCRNWSIRPTRCRSRLSIWRPFSRFVTFRRRIARAFLAAYDQAHPGRRETGEAAAGTRVISLVVPDLGNARRNQAVDAMIAEYARQLVRLAALMKD